MGWANEYLCQSLIHTDQNSFSTDKNKFLKILFFFNALVTTVLMGWIRNVWLVNLCGTFKWPTQNSKSKVCATYIILTNSSRYTSHTHDNRTIHFHGGRTSLEGTENKSALPLRYNPPRARTTHYPYGSSPCTGACGQGINTGVVLCLAWQCLPGVFLKLQLTQILNSKFPRIMFFEAGNDLLSAVMKIL